MIGGNSVEKMKPLSIKMNHCDTFRSRLLLFIIFDACQYVKKIKGEKMKSVKIKTVNTSINFKKTQKHTLILK